MNSSENKIDTSSFCSKKVNDFHCYKKVLTLNVREKAQILVENKDGPACLLDPLGVLLNSNMSKSNEKLLLTEGVAAVDLFFDEWKIISKLFFRTGSDGISERTAMFSKELVEASYSTLAEAHVGRVPVPIPQNLSREGA